MLLVSVFILAFAATTFGQNCNHENNCCICEKGYGKPKCYYPGTSLPTRTDVVYSVGDSGGCCTFCNYTRLVNGQYQSRIVQNIESTSYSTCPEMTCVDTGKPNEWAACCLSNNDRGNCDQNNNIPDNCFQAQADGSP